VGFASARLRHAGDYPDDGSQHQHTGRQEQHLYDCLTAGDDLVQRLNRTVQKGREAAPRFAGHRRIRDQDPADDQGKYTIITTVTIAMTSAASVSRAKKAQKLTSIAAYRLTSAIWTMHADYAGRGALDRVIIVGIMDKGQHRVRDQVHRRDVMLDLRGRSPSS
jgi:hypothetical protein